MEYTAIVKEAWRVTWRYKILWLFGLFVGAGGSGSSGGSRSYSNTGSNASSGSNALPSELTNVGQQMTQWAQANLGLLIALGIALVLVGIVFWIVSVAARGGLIHLVNEAEEQRDVRAGSGWSAGFGRWWSIFGVRFLLYLPFVLVIFVLLLVTLLPWLLSVSSTPEPGLPAIFGTCGVVVVLFLVLVVLGFVVSLVSEFAERHVMLGGADMFPAIGAGWQDLRTHFKDVLLMWLLTVVIGIVYGIVVVIALLILGGGALVAFLVGGPCGGALVALALLGVLLLPSAIYGTFVSAMWTIFWREMTGRGTLTRLPGTPVLFPSEIPLPPDMSAIPAPPAPPAG